MTLISHIQRTNASLQSITTAIEFKTTLKGMATPIQSMSARVKAALAQNIGITSETW